MTADVDVTVEIAQTAKLTFVDELAGAGFDLRFRLGEDLLREAHLLPLVHVATGMPIDVVIAASSLHLEQPDLDPIAIGSTPRSPRCEPHRLGIHLGGRGVHPIAIGGTPRRPRS